MTGNIVSFDIGSAQIKLVWCAGGVCKAAVSAPVPDGLVRGGTIVGEHEVIFAGPEEVITISHSAGSREVFANGALNAAVFLAGKPAGMYNMKDLMHL